MINSSPPKTTYNFIKKIIKKQIFSAIFVKNIIGDDYES